MKGIEEKKRRMMMKSLPSIQEERQREQRLLGLELTSNQEDLPSWQHHS